MVQNVLIILLFLILAGPVASYPRNNTGGSPVPAAAKVAGYTTNTYHTGPFTTSNVDTAETYTAGFQWYPYNLSGGSTPASSQTINADGSITILNGTAIASSGSIGPSPFYHGNAFGCGAYFTAEIAFDPIADVVGGGYPAWWTMAWENLVGYRNSPPSAQWSGQTTGYVQFIENDFFEFDRLNSPPSRAYGATLHNWYGLYSLTCTAFCDVPSNFNSGTNVPPPYTDWTLYHRIAALWIPATGSTNGTMQYFFDDVQLKPAFTWTQFINNGLQTPPPTGSTTWLYGVMDTQHMLLILGGGGARAAGVNMNVRSVDVWQNASACNISN